MTSSTQSLAHRSPYLVNPVYDLLFVCGGLALLMAALCFNRFGIDIGAAQASVPLLALGLVGTYMLSGPHTGATICRLYGERENRQRFLLAAYILPALLAAGFIAGLFIPAVAAVGAGLYLIFVWHHYMAQSYGVTMMYCARAGMQLSKQDKLLPKAILYLSVTVAVAQQLTAGWQRQSFMGIALRSVDFIPAPVLQILQAFLLGAILFFLHRQLRNKSRMPLPAMTTLLVTAAFLTLSRNLSDIVWLFVPNFFHATQYLSVVFAYENKKLAKEPGTEVSTIERLSRRYLIYFLLGLALFTGLPFAVSAMGYPLYLCIALAFFALSLHHFAADACIWKLKDKTVHSRLVT